MRKFNREILQGETEDHQVFSKIKDKSKDKKHKKRNNKTVLLLWKITTMTPNLLKCRILTSIILGLKMT